MSRFSTIPWLDYFNAMLGDAAIVTKKEVVLLGVPKFMANFVNLLDETPRRYATYFIYLIQYLHKSA